MKKNLLLEFCSCCKEQNSHSFYYDHQRKMNMINISGKEIPYIDTTKELINLITKTNILGEADDNSNGSEEWTKTEIKRESDDYHAVFGLTEIDTKTFIKKEEDQEDFEKLNFDTITKVKGESLDYNNELIFDIK